MENLNGTMASVAPTEPGDRLLTAGQVAEFLEIPRKRVYELGIPLIRISTRTLRWMLSDLIEWRDKRRTVR